MVAVLQGRVSQTGCGNRLDQIALKLFDTRAGGRPALDLWRLDDDEFDFCRAVKHPLRLGGTHAGGSVEHQLLVFFSRHGNASAKLPIQNDGLAADAAHQVGRAKDTRQQITKADTRLDFVLHRLVGVYFVKQRQAHHDLLIVEVLRQHLVFVLRADHVNALVFQNGADGVV